MSYASYFRPVIFGLEYGLNSSLLHLPPAYAGDTADRGLLLAVVRANQKFTEFRANRRQRMQLADVNEGQRARQMMDLLQHATY